MEYNVMQCCAVRACHDISWTGLEQNGAKCNAQIVQRRRHVIMRNVMQFNVRNVLQWSVA